jgi:CDP-glucose 4,6-dehydratase
VEHWTRTVDALTPTSTAHLASSAPAFWRDRVVLVTGATGFVGAQIVRHLLARHARVVCLQRDAVATNGLDLFDLRARVSVVTGGVEDVALCSRVLNEYGVDAVFHLAAQATVGVANRAPLSTFESNIRGTYCLLEACRTSGHVTRIVVASSDKAYGAHADLPYREDFALLGRFPYDVSKVCADLIAQSFAHTYDLPVSITRSANVYGPGDTNRTRIIPGTIHSILNDEHPIVRSDGTPMRDFVFVDDLVNGYVLLAEQIEQARGNAYNFGTNMPVSMLDLVQRIIRLAGRPATLTPQVLGTGNVPQEIETQYLSSNKVESQFGWTPRVSLDEGLARTITWFGEQRPRF